ncbi:MAG: hypothetical protein HYS14_09385 [Candidatus Rokubacteria bacterium]|nr:hypothetical protein [Candidatus Rokubacteria bacterium]
MRSEKSPGPIGLAIVGAGRIGLIRGEIAAKHPSNRLVALDNYRRTDRPETISPMVISGTHALDLVMWLLEAHNRLMLTKALDLSARRKRALPVPISPEDEER